MRLIDPKKTVSFDFEGATFTVKSITQEERWQIKAATSSLKGKPFEVIAASIIPFIIKIEGIEDDLNPTNKVVEGGDAIKDAINRSQINLVQFMNVLLDSLGLGSKEVKNSKSPSVGSIPVAETAMSTVETAQDPVSITPTEQ